MSDPGRTGRWPATIVAGVAIGTVEAVFAIAFATLVFVGRLDYFLADGIGLYLGAAFLTLAGFAWWAGRRGTVGGMLAAGAALLSLMAATTGIRAHGGPFEGFLAVVAGTVVVTIACGVIALVLGARRRGGLLGYIPVPVVGGFLAGVGWLLLRGGIHVAFGESPFYTDLAELFEGRELRLWLPAFAFGVLLLVAVRLVRSPLVLPIGLAAGLVGFAAVAVAMGASIDDVRRGGWLIGPFKRDAVWQPVSIEALTDADWMAVGLSWAQILVAVLVTVLALRWHVGRTELQLDRDLDTDRELRDAGLVTSIAGAAGGIPGAPARSLTAIAGRLRADPRRAGFVAAALPLAVAVGGGELVELLPRALVGGVLVYLGLASLVEWVWDMRRVLPRIEYVVVLVIVAAVIARGYLAGVLVGLVLAVVLLAVSYGRLDLVHEVAFADVYRSRVDRPAAERALLRTVADRVQILRVRGFVFFGSTNNLLERIRARADAPPRFLVIDLQRVTGVDASAVAAFSTAERLAATHGSTIVLTGASDAIRARLERGGVLDAGGTASFEADLDHGLERCEDELLAEAGPPVADAPDAGATAAGATPSAVARYLERMPLAEGTVLLRQDEPPGDVYVLEEGRLAVETVTADGVRTRVRSLRPGVVVGEIALYAGVPRTADVVAETPCVVLRCSRDRIARIEAEEPEVAAALHRWLAAALADRLRDTMRGVDALLD